MRATQLELAPAEHLNRVRARIGGLVVDFWRNRLEKGPAAFRADDVRRWVEAYAPKRAPASADRILRNLRADGRINYRLLQRGGSLYEALPLPQEPAELHPKSMVAELREALQAANAALQRAHEELRRHGLPLPGEVES